MSEVKKLDMAASAIAEGDCLLLANDAGTVKRVSISELLSQIKVGGRNLLKSGFVQATGTINGNSVTFSEDRDSYISLPFASELNEDEYGNEFCFSFDVSGMIDGNRWDWQCPTSGSVFIIKPHNGRNSVVFKLTKVAEFSWGGVKRYFSTNYNLAAEGGGLRDERGENVTKSDKVSSVHRFKQPSEYIGGRFNWHDHESQSAKPLSRSVDSERFIGGGCRRVYALWTDEDKYEHSQHSHFGLRIPFESEIRYRRHASDLAKLVNCGDAHTPTKLRRYKLREMGGLEEVRVCGIVTGKEVAA